eukprot:Transcript_7881.p1 GENE.Transcript_7881~~Transcript_7881.p1  ORF type:complete len:381 (-),score=38.81 Transcript_7881:45-1187(-)
MTCRTLGNCVVDPLITLGVLSAADYQCRRAAIRNSWVQYPEVDSGEVLVRFLSAVGPDPPAKLVVESKQFGDVVMLQTNVTSRNIGPMLTVYRWLQYASVELPYSRAHYVAKLDDDGFVHVPEMVAHLRLLRDMGKPFVYYGIFYYTAWQVYNHRVGVSAYTIGQARHANGRCTREGNCSQAFGFAAAPAQIIGLDLATALAASPRAMTYTQGSRAILDDPKKNKTFATEDSFLGYAIHDLLPEGFTGVTLAKIDRYGYTFDDWGFFMKPTTIFFHDKMKSRFRMRAAWLYARDQACPTNVSLECGRRNPRSHYAEECILKPHNKSCKMRNMDLKRSKYFLCDVLSIAKLQAKNLSQSCLGLRQYGFNGTHDLKRSNAFC